MKIAIISDVLGEANNGTTLACLNLIKYLKSKGHTVNVVCDDETRKGQEGFFVVPKMNFWIFNNYVQKNGVAPAKVDKEIIAKALDGVDIVHVMLPFAAGNAACQMAKEKGIPVTAGFHAQAENVTSHFFMKDFFLANRIVYKVFYKKLYRYVDAIHYPTQFIRDVFEHYVGKTNGYVISNGVNSTFVKDRKEKPEELSDKFVILFIGRYSKEKEHKVLIKAVSKSKYEEKIQLIFAGTGPQEKKLKKLAKKKLTNMPIMKFFTRDELVNIINYADLYSHPAEVEIEAISCLEAISCGLVPVIANSKKCATKDFALTDKNLFKNKNANDLKDKIEYWMEHPEEKEQMEKQYLGYVTRFDQDTCMENMEKMMLEVISKKKA